MITSDQIRAARALLNYSNKKLADLAGMSVNTLTRAERGEAKTGTMVLLQSTFEAEGVLFIPENGGGAGVRLKS